jgi:phosphatidylglycerol:prolipoprotein diacylglycerol transferase
MSAAIAVPFVHTEFLLVAVVTAVATGALLPGWRLRRLAAAAIGVAVATVAAICGYVEWKGELHLAAYGALMLIGFTAAYALLMPRARLVGIGERRVIDIFLIAIAGGLAGARARYVWERPQEFFGDAGHPRPITSAIADAIDFDRGGMVWYGGLVLAAIGIVVYARATRLRVLALGDVAAPALLLGLGIGRIGCFINGCCYGHPTDVPWACLHDGVHVHPTQLYETAACAAMAGALWWFWRRRSSDGQVLFLGTVGYGIWRFINEYLRGDDKIPSNLFALPVHGDSWLDTSQATSLHLIVGAVVVAVVIHLHRRRHPEAAARARQVPGSIRGTMPQGVAQPPPHAEAVAS